MDVDRSLADANKDNLDKTEPNTEKAAEPPKQQVQEPAKPVPQLPVVKTDEHLQQKPIVQGNEPHVQRKSFANPFAKLRAIKINNLRLKIGHILFEYKRVLSLARKPTRQEYRELAIMVVVGTFIIGGIGFLIQLMIQVI